MNVVDSATSFEGLQEGLHSKIADLKILNQIRGGWGKDTVEEINICVQELRVMSRTVINFKAILQNGRREIDELKKSLLHLDHISERLTYMKNNLPAYVPGLQINTQSEEEEKAHTDLKQNMKTGTKTVEKLDENKATNPKNSKKVDDNKVAKPQKSLPRIEYITLDEYESVPKYTKGRISYDKINAAIDSLNKAIDGKYTLIRKPRSKLTPIELSMVTEYKKQINRESKGLHFITDDDMKKHAGMKLDPSGRNTLTILRTLKRLKEIRGPGNLVRYCIL